MAQIRRSLLMSMLELVREGHPREVVLLLRGEVRGGCVELEDFLIPPLTLSGRSFAEFPVHLLPIDFSIIGTAHSHPTESLDPSPEDLNNFYGLIMMIFAYPYSTSSLAVYNRRGMRIPLRIIDDEHKSGSPTMNRGVLRKT